MMQSDLIDDEKHQCESLPVHAGTYMGVQAD